MKPLTLRDIVLPSRYGPLRDAYRRAVIAHKNTRRMAVGDRVTLVFEDRETLRFQIQEMVWIERIQAPAKIQDEIDVYSELLPRANGLSATLFIEITDAERIRPELDRLVGIDEHVFLVLGEGDDREEVAAEFDPKQMEEDRISAVQYIRFGLDEQRIARLADPDVPASIRIDHPSYRQEAALPPELRRSLVEGLRDETPALLPVPEGSGADEAAGVIFESERVRATRAAHPRAPIHVEARDPEARLLTAGPELLQELAAALQRAAALLVDESGGCRLRADVDAERPGVRFALAPRR